VISAVGHLWIVDPILRTLEVYHLETSPWVDAYHTKM
jgi:hypothetical protein